MDEKLRDQIVGFQEAYNAFENCWLDYIHRQNVEVINFKRKRIKELDISNTSGLDLMLYIFLFRSYIAQNLPSSVTMYLDSIGIRRSRVKEKISLMQKIYKNIDYDKNGSSYIYITRCVNDVFGARIIVDNIADTKALIDELMLAFPKLRVTNANKSTGYKAIHLYTNPSKGCLPWELQIWQACDEISNTALHAEYKRDYIKEIRAVKEVNN